MVLHVYCMGQLFYPLLEFVRCPDFLMHFLFFNVGELHFLLVVLELVLNKVFLMDQPISLLLQLSDLVRPVVFERM